LYLPIFELGEEDQYVGFFHTGAYQESLGGYGGIQHCLIPAAQHVLVDRDENGNIVTKLFANHQESQSMLQILGYDETENTNGVSHENGHYGIDLETIEELAHS
jgi:arginine decarboxylase